MRSLYSNHIMTEPWKNSIPNSNQISTSMKSARPPKRKAVRAPKEHIPGKDGPATKKPSRNSQQSRRRVQHSPPSSTVEAFPQQLLVKDTHSPQTRKELSVLELYPRQTLCNPSAKIKLQLFPIDDNTRLVLEKDGHNPYLELTLRAQKKIASVLKHLNSKWGCSSVAHGELILFPYKMLENFIGSRGWTVNDSDVSAGDVYAAIGSPAVFRLRYGWFSDSDTTTCFEFSLRPEEIEERFSSKLDGTRDGTNPVEARSEEFKPINAAIKETNAAVAETIPSDESVDSVDAEVKLDDRPVQPSSFWDDGLTNISIGGLLSEASLHGRINNCDPKPSESNTGGFQPSQLISDSFDSFIAAQINQSQAPRLPQDIRSSSILDAEDTCHAFPSQKPPSSTKDNVMALRGSAFSGICSQDSGSKSFKSPKPIEVNGQFGLPQGQACQGSETDLLLYSRTYSDESSLGLRGIKWNDSLGPFDFGMSSGKVTEGGGGDSMSLSGFVR